jgi:hypothetical protein
MLPPSHLTEKAMAPVPPGEERQVECEFADFIDPVTGNRQRVLFVRVQGMPMEIAVNLDLSAVNLDAPPAVTLSRSNTSAAVPDNPPGWARH